MFVQEFLEAGLLCVQIQEENKVVNAETNVDGMSGSCRWCTISGDTVEEAGVMLGGDDTHVYHNLSDYILPVLRQSPQVV